MSLIPWKPFDPFEDMNALMERSGLVPPVDMYQTKDAVVVETPMAGVDADQLEVTVTDGVLTIQGSMERKTEVDEKDYYRKEVRSGSVFRRIVLPTAVKNDAADASLENGMLRVTIPKLMEPDVKPVKIQVKKK
jgi:HSP20 family protein